MAKTSWYTAFREAYLDLHTAYLALLRMRHERHQSLAMVIQKDMENADPFGLANPAGPDAVKRWLALWNKHESAGRAAQAMAAVSEAMANHWKSWSTFMDMCPPDLRKFKIDMPFDTYMMTATTISRGTLEKRARVLKEAWKRQARGDK